MLRGTLHRGCRFVVGVIVLLTVARLGVTPVSGESGPPGVHDTSPPTGTILNPLPGTWLSLAYFYLSVRFTDPDGISTFEMTLDGITLSSSFYDFVLSANAYGLPEGLHTATARASDQLGNGPTVLSWSFSTDTRRPEAEITFPVGNPTVADGSLVMTWTGNDTGSGIDHFLVKLDDGPDVDVGKVVSFPFHNLSAGVHYFSLTPVDAAGNTPYYQEVAVATVPPPPASPRNTTLIVTLSNEVIRRFVAGLAIAAIVGLALRPRREPPGREPPNA